MEWQPMETAPKDGTGILTYPHFRVTHYATEDIHPGEGWVDEFDDGIEQFVAMRTPPTHWMPLPPPPADVGHG